MQHRGLPKWPTSYVLSRMYYNVIDTGTKERKMNLNRDKIVSYGTLPLVPFQAKAASLLLLRTGLILLVVVLPGVPLVPQELRVHL